MTKTVFSNLARFLATRLPGGQPVGLLSTSASGTRSPTAGAPARTVLPPDLSPFARWVGELDDEATTYISRQQLSKVLSQSQKKSAAVKRRQSARRKREMLARPLPMRS